jgi:hypothetical protein
MSLSGLDSSAVEAAYRTVLEKTGWYVLHCGSQAVLLPAMQF